MRIDILTIFPGIFEGFLRESLMGKAIARGLLRVELSDIRRWATDRHRTVDDKPFGGGPGMVLKVEPIYRALSSLKLLPRTAAKRKRSRVYVLSPQGKTLTQELAVSLAQLERLVLICGHYEGVDERVLGYCDGELSIGDYVLSGGEVAAMAVTESVARHLPGFVKERASVVNDSFSERMLDHPVYTRPAVFRGLRVPAVLTSGDHARIAAWRKEQAHAHTRKKKPYLLTE